MRAFYLTILFVSLAHICNAQNPSTSPNQAEFNAFIQNLESEFIYYADKKDIIACINEQYAPYVDTISHPYYKVHFYEQVLNELYDSHINLNSNTDKSYRIYAPIYVKENNDGFVVSNVFSQVEVDFPNIINATIMSFNDQPFDEILSQFPTHCHDKNHPVVREWLANKILAGKRNKPRVLALRLSNGQQATLDLDSMRFKPVDEVLSSSIMDNIGYLRINNSLGNTDLITTFDSTLDTMMDTKALIIDVRNTPDGGNTGVAEPIMGRFIAMERGYQIVENKDERYTRTVAPRGKQYTKPVYILAGRWTGSMGEGMTIGFDGMGRGTVVGTEMHRLAGSMKTINFLKSNFGYRISFEKLYHLDGTLRETFVPEEYITQTDPSKDEMLEYALRLIAEGED